MKTYTDLPHLVRLEETGDGEYTAGKFLTAADLAEHADEENAAFKTVLIDARTGDPVVPNGSLGHRYGDAGVGRWNLELGDVDPVLSLLDTAEESVVVRMPRFDTPDGAAADLPRGVPTRRIGGHLVTTVFDLLLAQYGVARSVGGQRLPGEWAQGYDDADSPYTPAWQETITGVPAATAARIGREFAANAEESHGRSMIVMGAGTNHWFHSDTIYRAFLTLTNLTGCQGVNGGGWAHYVGQEKVRPITGYTQIANALDWNRPPRNMIQTAFWYLHTDQFRYDQFGADTLSATTGHGQLAGKSTADVIAQSARMGWMPSYPTFDRNPLDLSDDAAAAGKPVGEYVVEQLKSGDLDFAGEDPDAPGNYPRILSIWRANLLGSSGKGNEYFLKHLLGTDSSVRATETPEGQRPVDVRWRDEAPEGKLDLLMTIDFRQTSTTIFSDVVLPAATWYEKHDLNTTDMHPFVHSFNPAIAPPWQTRTDWDAWQTIAERFSELAATHLGVRKDVVAVPLTHDTPDAMANPHGVVRDWKKGECEPIPGVTMPKLVEVERDYGAVSEKMNALGPAGRHPRRDHQGRHLRAQQAGRLPAPEERPRARRRRRRPAVAQARRQRLRGDPRPVRYDERAPGHAGLQDPREAHRGEAGRPRRGARGQADHLRRHPGPTRPGDHLTGVVRLGDRRPSLLAVHDQRRAQEALAHPDRADALLPRPRLDHRAR